MCLTFTFGAHLQGGEGLGQALLEFRKPRSFLPADPFQLEPDLATLWNNVTLERDREGEREKACERAGQRES